MILSEEKTQNHSRKLKSHAQKMIPILQEHKTKICTLNS